MINAQPFMSSRTLQPLAIYVIYSNTRSAGMWCQPVVWNDVKQIIKLKLGTENSQ